MLEKMREAAAALRFKAKTYFVVNAYSDNGGGGVWCDDHLESIGKRGRFDGYVHCGRLPGFREKQRYFCVMLRITEGSV
jgi:hypothetical protein